MFVYSAYFTFFLILAFIEVSVFKNHKVPIEKNKAYPRIFGFLPLKEMVLFPPSSFLLVWFIRWYYKLEINFPKMIIESTIYFFITGILIHALFGVKTKLNHVLGLSGEPDGTGVLPYPNY